MAGIRLNRVARNRWRTIATWAMLPLALFNSRIVLGCGCSGRFQSVCHCECRDSHDVSHGDKCVKCGGGNHSTCTSCGKIEKSLPVANGNPSDSSTTLYGSRCKVAVVHEIIPATLVTVYTWDELSLSASDFDTIDFPVTTSQPRICDISIACNGPPPSDLVVTLRRLVI
jgi:hypothetical protein